MAPRIPFSESRSHVPAEHTGAQQHDAGRGTAEVAKALSDFSTKLDQARHAHQVDAAKNEALKQMDQLRTEASQKDYTEAPDYFNKGVEKIKTHLKENYANVWSDIQPSVERMGIVQSHDVQKEAFNKEQDAATAEFNDHMNTLAQSASTADNPVAEKTYKDQIDESAKNASGHFITAQQADNAKQQALSNADYWRAERLIQSNPSDALKAIDGALPDLQPQQRITLRDKAQAEVKSHQREAQVRLNGRLKDDIWSIQTQGSGVPGIDAEMKAAGYSQEQINQHIQSQQVAKKTYDVSQTLKTATPEQMKTEVENLKPEKGAKNYHEQWKLYQNAQSQAQRIQKARENDPGGYVDSVHPPDTNQPLEQQIGNRMDHEASMGIQNAKPLSNHEAQSFVSEWTHANPADKTGMIDQWEQKSGRYFNQVLGQLQDNKLPTMAVLMTNADPITRDDEAQVSDMKMSDLHKLVPNASAVDTAVDQDSGWKSFESTLPPNAPQKLAYRQDVNKLALLYASRGKDPQDAADKAVQNALMQGHTVAGTIRVPNDYNADQVGAYASHMLDHLPNDLDTRSSHITENQFKMAAKSGKWITNPDESGAILYVNNAPVRKKDGSLFEFDFSDAENYHPQRGNKYTRNHNIFQSRGPNFQPDTGKPLFEGGQ